LRLIDENTGYLKRATILLFYSNPERFFTGAYIKIGFFLKDDAGLVFQDEVHGPIMEQIDKAYDLLTHKDYSSGIPIQISVYTDHIVFWNPGTLPEQIPMNKLFQKHSSIPFNPDIANTLFRSGI